jgi:imidazolonepropionase-like amidohydrolase
MIRKRSCPRAGLALAAAVALSSPAVAGQALVGATLIDGSGRVIEDGVVIVDGDRLACVGSRVDCPLEPELEFTDFSGRFITPGLIDAHVHFAQTGWLDGRPDANPDPAVYPYEEVVAGLRADPGRWHRAYLCSGVTAVFDVGGAPWTVSDAQATDTQRSDRAHRRAAGPLVTHAGLNQVFATGTLADQPVFLPMESAEQIRADVARLAEMGSAAVKVWYLLPPPEQAEALDALLIEVGNAARTHGLPLIVHATELHAAKRALQAGARMLVHSVEDQPVDEEFLRLLVAKGAAYAPTLIVGDGWRRAEASMAFAAPMEVDDPNRCVDEDVLEKLRHPERLSAAFRARSNESADRHLDAMKATARQELLMAANLRAVRDAGGRIVLGTDAGNPLTPHGASIHRELEAMQAAGMRPTEIIRAATLEAARVMGLSEQIGSLERGKIADLLVLAEDPRKSTSAFRSLTHVMRAGRLKRQEALRLR